MVLNVFVLNACVLKMSSNQRHKKMNMLFFRASNLNLSFITNPYLLNTEEVAERLSLLLNFAQFV